MADLASVIAPVPPNYLGFREPHRKSKGMEAEGVGGVTDPKPAICIRFRYQNFSDSEVKGFWSFNYYFLKCSRGG